MAFSSNIALLPSIYRIITLGLAAVQKSAALAQKGKMEEVCHCQRFIGLPLLWQSSATTDEQCEEYANFVTNCLELDKELQQASHDRSQESSDSMARLLHNKKGAHDHMGQFLSDAVKTNIISKCKAVARIQEQYYGYKYNKNIPFHIHV